MVNNAQKAAVLEEVIDHIRRLHYDVRAEVVVGELLDNHVQESEVAVQMQNVFTRAFNKDILDAQLDDSQPYHPFITLTLSRDGLYDRLPEGLFHAFSPQKQQEVSEMVATYKKHQQEEQEARKFFRPLEHEFFLQRVFLEQREKHLLFDALGKDADELFRTFWGILEGLPKEPINKLIRLLPYIHRIAGNLPLVQLYLQAILEEPVTITCENGTVAISAGTTQAGLGECSLGVDTMTGNLFYTDMPRVIVKIGPLQQHRVYDFLAWQPYGKLLRTCLEFMLPADVESETLLVPHPDEKQVVVNDDLKKDGLIGYNFFL